VSSEICLPQIPETIIPEGNIQGQDYQDYPEIYPVPEACKSFSNKKTGVFTKLFLLL